LPFKAKGENDAFDHQGALCRYGDD
jgi:hypothetical protein